MTILSADELSKIPHMDGSSPAFDHKNVPDSPHELFAQWFRAAVEAGVPDPRAATLATIAEDDTPDARIIDLYELTEDGGYCFTTAAGSEKFVQLDSTPVAALNFFWQPQVRTARVRGTVVEGDAPFKGASKWIVQAQQVEFWQLGASDLPLRIRYARREDGTWRREIIGH